MNHEASSLMIQIMSQGLKYIPTKIEIDTYSIFSIYLLLNTLSTLLSIKYNKPNSSISQTYT